MKNITITQLITSLFGVIMQIVNSKIQLKLISCIRLL